MDILDIRDRSDVKPDMIKRLSKADGVMMSGGNQLRLTTIFGGTAFLELMKRRYQDEAGFVIAGTSAGAMCMSSTMIYQGHSSIGLIKGGVKMTTGAGLIHDVIIDSHFVERGRFSRLTQAVAGNPNAIGIGLGEDTGVVITNADMLETIGSGQVMIFDGHEITYSDYRGCGGRRALQHRRHAGAHHLQRPQLQRKAAGLLGGAGAATELIDLFKPFSYYFAE